MKANSNQAVIATLARLGAGADVVSEGELRPRPCCGRAGRKDPVLRRRQDCAGVGFRARRGHPLLQRRNPSQSSNCCPKSPPPVAWSRRSEPCASIRTSTRARTKRSPPAARRTVRHPHRPRPRRLCAGRGAARHPISWHRHAYRQPDHRALARSTMLSRCSIPSATCAPTATRSSMSISAAVSAFPTTRAWRSARSPPPMPTSSGRTTQGLDCPLIFEPGRLIVGNAGIIWSRECFSTRRQRKDISNLPARESNDLRPPDPVRAARDWPDRAPRGSHRVAYQPLRGRPICETGFSRPRPHDGRAQSPAISSPSFGRRLWRGAGRSLNSRPLVPEVLSSPMANSSIVRPPRSRRIDRVGSNATMAMNAMASGSRALFCRDAAN